MVAIRRQSVRPLLVALALVGSWSFVAADSLRWVGASFPGFFLWDNGTLVSFHRESWTGATAAMPLNGGRIVGFEGRPFAGAGELLELAANRPPGTPLRYAVLHQGAEREVVVETMQLSLADWIWTFGNYLLNAAFCFAIAILALWLRPELPSSRALALVMTLLGAVLVLSIDLFAAHRASSAYFVVQSLTPAGIVALLLVFPSERFDARGRWRIVSAAFGVGVLVGIVNVWLFFANPEFARSLTLASLTGIGLAGFATVASLGEATIRAPTGKRRLQAAAVFSGALVSFFVPSILMIAFAILGWTFSFTWVTAFIFLFPVSILYAIVRHDLFDAERFIRVTLGYAVASSAVVLGYATTVTALEEIVGRPGGSRAASFLVLVLLAIAFDPLRRMVQHQIDLRFFQSRRDAAGVLEAAGQALVTLRDEDLIRSEVSARLSDALALDWATAGAEATPPAESELWVPIRFGDEQLGTLAVGPKRSGAPFSIADRDLIGGLASQVALAVHNARAIDALTEAQAALARSERLSMLGEFAAAVAHGIRNPLSGIRATAENARDESQQAETDASLRAILSEADRLDLRIRSLLDLARPFEPEIRSVSLPALLHTVGETMRGRATRQGTRLSVETPDALQVSSDPDYLEEALLELVGNALRAVDGLDAEVRVEARAGESHHEIRVIDTGPGIPETIQPRVFDLFFTTSPEGTGVGLAAVRRIVESLGGEVSLEASAPGHTAFRISLRAR